MEPLHEYDTPHLSDPLVRCDNCARLVAVKFINKHAGCNHCGNKRFQMLYLINDEEMNKLRLGEYDLGIKDYKVPISYLDIFTEIEE